SPYVGGSLGYDGLFVIKPDGKLYVTSGIGNLGTHSVFDTTRAAAEVLDFPWEKVEVAWGDTSRNLPWSASQGGSQSTHAHTRANWEAGLDAKRKLQFDLYYLKHMSFELDMIILLRTAGTFLRGAC
ncbi:MAG: molybdopterin-dependent oxidoreductase, partial [Planctomycetes bacterium]|nr:molybdopterin-dependent oxidoreductase [Planctomycetota bacterium]